MRIQNVPLCEIALSVDSCVSRGDGVSILLFGLFFFSDRRLNDLVTDLSNQFANYSLIVEREFKGAFNGVLVSGIRVRQLDVYCRMPSLDNSLNADVFERHE